MDSATFLNFPSVPVMLQVPDSGQCHLSKFSIRTCDVTGAWQWTVKPLWVLEFALLPVMLQVRSGWRPAHTQQVEWRRWWRTSRKACSTWRWTVPPLQILVWSTLLPVMLQVRSGWRPAHTQQVEWRRWWRTSRKACSTWRWTVPPLQILVWSTLLPVRLQVSPGWHHSHFTAGGLATMAAFQAATACSTWRVYSTTLSPLEDPGPCTLPSQWLRHGRLPGATVSESVSLVS